MIKAAGRYRSMISKFLYVHIRFVIQNGRESTDGHAVRFSDGDIVTYIYIYTYADTKSGQFCNFVVTADKVDNRNVTGKLLSFFTGQDKTGNWYTFPLRIKRQKVLKKKWH